MLCVVCVCVCVYIFVSVCVCFSAYVVQLQLCEQRAVTAEEALQGALLRILHLESRLHDQISMEPAGTTRTRDGPVRLFGLRIS